MSSSRASIDSSSDFWTSARLSPQVATCVLALTVIVWGSTFLVTERTVEEIPPLTLACGRFVIAGIALAALLPFANTRIPIWRAGARRSLVLMALTGVAGFTVAFNFALSLGSAAEGAVIYAFVPAAIVIVARLMLGERISVMRGAGVAVSIVGVAIVVLSGEPHTGSPRPLLAAGCMIIAVASWAFYTVLAKRRADDDPVGLLAVASGLGAAILLPGAGVELAYHPIKMPSAAAWGGLIFLGLIASAAAYLCYAVALRSLEAGRAGVFVNLDPVVGVVAATLFAGETLSGRQLVGGGCVLLGLILSSLPANSRSPTYRREKACDGPLHKTRLLDDFRS